MNTVDSKKNCIFVGGIPSEATPITVSQYFSRFGKVSKVKLNKTRSGQRDRNGPSVQHRGCGFIEMETKEGVSKVLNAGEHYIYGQKLDCRLAMTNRERKTYHQALNQERRKVFIGKLPKEITKDCIENFFKQLVEIEETTLIQKESKDFAICFLLLKEKYSGELLIGKSFEVQPSVIVDCQLALNPQQLYQRKLAEDNTENSESEHSLGLPVAEVAEPNAKKGRHDPSIESDLSTRGGHSPNRRIGTAVSELPDLTSAKAQTCRSSNEVSLPKELPAKKKGPCQNFSSVSKLQVLAHQSAKAPQLSEPHLRGASYNTPWGDDGANQRTPAPSLGYFSRNNIQDGINSSRDKYRESIPALGVKLQAQTQRAFDSPLADILEVGDGSKNRQQEVDSPYPFQPSSKHQTNALWTCSPRNCSFYASMKSKYLSSRAMKQDTLFYSPFRF